MKVLLLGSGELGKELTISLKRLGIEVVACDKYEGAPAMQVADKFCVFDMLDAKMVKKIIKQHKPDYIVPEVEAIRTETEGSKKTGSTSLGTGTWTHFVSVLNGTQLGDLDHYINSVLEGISSSSGLTNTINTDNIGGRDVNIGRGYTGSAWEYFTGILDEIRISNTARSTDWISTEYNNQHDPSSFMNFGPEEPIQ